MGHIKPLPAMTADKFSKAIIAYNSKPAISQNHRVAHEFVSQKCFGCVCVNVIERNWWSPKDRNVISIFPIKAYPLTTGE